MMKWLWGGMLAIGIIGCMVKGAPDVADTMTAGALEAVELCISLAGGYMLFMGLIKLAERAGLIAKLARLTSPAIGRLFPDSPSAAAPITLNLAMNFFGMGSAATPFGLAAMRELEKTNRSKGRATNDMCMFLCLNAAALELIPANVLALRSAYGGARDVILPTFIASVAAFLTAVLLCRLFSKRA